MSEQGMRGATNIAREARALGATDAADLIWHLIGIIDDMVNDQWERGERLGRDVLCHRDEMPDSA